MLGHACACLSLCMRLVQRTHMQRKRRVGVVGQAGGQVCARGVQARREMQVSMPVIARARPPNRPPASPPACPPASPPARPPARLLCFPAFLPAGVTPCGRETLAAAAESEGPGGSGPGEAPRAPGASAAARPRGAYNRAFAAKAFVAFRTRPPVIQRLDETMSLESFPVHFSSILQYLISNSPGQMAQARWLTSG